MKQRTLGRTGLSVSEIGFGAVEIGLEYGIQVSGRANMPNPQEAVRIVQRALDLGVNVIDTARGYGESERLIGLALRGRRDSVVLMTKVAAIDPSLTGQAVYDFVSNSLETSLSLLQTETVDLYQIHSAKIDVIQRGELVDALDRQRQAGKARFLGATVYTEEEAMAVLDDPRIDVLQIPYSMLDASMNDRVIPRAAKQGVGVVARSVLHRGVLTPKGANGSAEEQRLHRAANEFDFVIDANTYSLPHAAVRFVLSNPNVSCALLGMDSIEQVEANLSYGEFVPLSDEQLQRVRELAPPDPWSILPTPSHRERK